MFAPCSHRPAGPPGLFALLALGALAGACLPARTQPPLDISFADVTAASGLPTAVQSAVLAVRDFDQDGWPDLLVLDASWHLVIYRNHGLGLFDRRPVDAALPSHVSACTAGDLDGDGYPDIVCGGDDAYVLLHNDGTSGFSFQQVAIAGTPTARPTAIVIADFQGNGHPEAVAGSFPNFPSSFGPCTVRPDRTTCQFEGAGPTAYGLDRIRLGAGGGYESTPIAEIPPSHTNDLEVLDWNGDGRPDLFQSDDFDVDHLWVQDADGRFHDQWPALGASQYNHGMGVTFADFDGDGGWDAYVDEVGPGELWLSRGPRLTEGSAALGLLAPTADTATWAPLAADFDNDGDADLFVAATAHAASASGLVQVLRGDPTPNSLPKLQGDDLFENRFSEKAGFAHGFVPAPGRLKSVGLGLVAAADFDGDGLVDVIELIEGWDSGALRLLHNTSATGNHWLGLQLEGHVPQVTSAGATVIVTAGGREVGRVFDGPRGLGVSSEVLHFGLGPATSCHVQVLLPGGQRREFDVARVDRVIVYDEL